MFTNKRTEQNNALKNELISKIPAPMNQITTIQHRIVLVNCDILNRMSFIIIGDKRHPI